MKKRIIAGLFCLLMLSVLLPGMAMAATRNTTLDCTGFTGDESGEGWNWVQSSKTLTIVKAADPFSSTPTITNNAIVFAGSGNGNLQLMQSGTVSSDFFLDMLPGASNEYEVPSGMTLTVSSGSTFQTSGFVTIHNYGTITNEGTLGNYGSILLYGTGLVGGTGTVEGTGQIQKVEQTSGGTPAMWYTVTATAGSGGTITPSGKLLLIAAGQRQEFSFNPAAGYFVESVTVNGSPVTIKDNSYTLEVRGDSTIQVIFAPIMEPPQTGDASSQYGLVVLIMAAGLVLMSVSQYVKRRQS